MANLQELLVASALITTCESICTKGLLPESEEQNLRELIARCCRAFNVPSIAERVQSNVVDIEYARMVEAVTRGDWGMSTVTANECGRETK